MIKPNHIQYSSFQWTRLSLLVLAALHLVSCTTTSILTPYPAQMAQRLKDIDRNNEVKSISTAGKWHPNQLLHHLENGRLMQIKQNPTESAIHYRAAIKKFDQHDMDAVIELSKLGEQSTSFFTNDNALDYEGELYERVFVHTYQALNYLFLQDLEAAGVEIRRLNQVKKDALSLNEKLLLKQRERNDIELERLSFDKKQFQNTVDERFSYITSEAGKLRDSFENVYSFLISALIYECRNELNDAYIDYKKAIALQPQNRFTLQSLAALSQKLGFRQEFYQWKRRLKQPTRADFFPAKKDHGEVIVLYEKGFIPPKKEIRFSVQDLSGKIISIALPTYTPFADDLTPLQINLGQARSVQTALVSETTPMAAKALQDKQAALVAKQVTRAIAKSELYHQSSKEGGSFGSVAANLYNIITERADLRSWLSLPSNLQFARFTATPGQHSLHMLDRTSSTLSNDMINIVVGRKTFIYVINTGSRLHVQSVLI